MIDAQSVLLRERELAVVPPAERFLGLLEEPKRIVEAERQPIAKRRALRVGKKHLAAPEVGIVYVAIFNNARRPTALTGPLDILGVLLALFPGS